MASCSRRHSSRAVERARQPGHASISNNADARLRIRCVYKPTKPRPGTGAPLWSIGAAGGAASDGCPIDIHFQSTSTGATTRRDLPAVAHRISNDPCHQLLKTSTTCDPIPLMAALPFTRQRVTVRWHASVLDDGKRDLRSGQWMAYCRANDSDWLGHFALAGQKSKDGVL